MPYTAEISRAKPTAFCFLIDQSGSMDDPYGMDSGKRKCDAVADAVNRLIATLVLRCAKGEDVRDYFQIAVIGYGGAVRTGFGGAACRAAVCARSRKSPTTRCESRRGHAKKTMARAG